MTRPGLITIVLALCFFAGLAIEQATSENVKDPARPDAIDVENVPLVPADVVDELKRYQDMRSASFLDWAPASGGILITTRHENLYQLHSVAAPGETPRLLTHKNEPVQSGLYGAGNTVIFSRSRGGNERFQIYRLDPDTGKERLLTDGESRNVFSTLSPDRKKLSFTSTKRNGRDADIYIAPVDASTRPRLLFEVSGETWWIEDWTPDQKRVVVLRYVSKNETYALLIDVETGEKTPVPHELRGRGSAQGAEGIARDDYHFGPAGKTLFFLSDARSEFRELAHVNLDTGESSWLTRDIPWDVEDFAISDDRKRAVFGVNADGYSELHVLEDLSEKLRRRKLSLSGSLISRLRFSTDGKRIGFSLGRPNQPTESHSFDLESEKLTRWTFSERAGFREEDFVSPELIRYPSFDSNEIPAFLFLPKKAPEKNKRRPVVITIHGGPESQYRPWFSSFRQHYVRDLGAAVIAPNVRGSYGYGKTFSLLDNGTKREDSVRDIGALLDWIRDEGSKKYGLDPERVAVSGGSYGGYMVLASLVLFGERIRAGIDSVGISDFITFLENTSDYRRHLRRAEYGDERDAKMRAYFTEISPARRIKQLRSALLLVHGKNDPRVPFSETVQIVKRARATGEPIWTVYADNEGHGFRRRENRDYLAGVRVVFLRKFLLD